MSGANLQGLPIFPIMRYLHATSQHLTCQSLWSCSFLSGMTVLCSEQSRVHIMELYEEAILDILRSLTCQRCKSIFTSPVTLQCGHTVCWTCAEDIKEENREGVTCCSCPKCGEESLMVNMQRMVNPTLCKVAALGHLLRECLETVQRPLADHESGVGSSCSIASIRTPPNLGVVLLSKTELFERMYQQQYSLEEGPESVCTPSDCFSVSVDSSEDIQGPDDEASPLQFLSSFKIDFHGDLCEPVLPQEIALSSSRANTADMLTEIISGMLQNSEYQSDMGWSVSVRHRFSRTSLLGPLLLMERKMDRICADRHHLKSAYPVRNRFLPSTDFAPDFREHGTTCGHFEDQEPLILHQVGCKPVTSLLIK